MKPPSSHIKRLFLVLALSALLTAALVSAPLVYAGFLGPETCLDCNKDLYAGVGRGDHDPVNGFYMFGLKKQETKTGVQQPYLLSVLGPAVSTYKLDVAIKDTWTPDVACSDNAGSCMATWGESGNIFARRVTGDNTNWSSVWKVDTDADAAFSRVTFVGPARYVVTWVHLNSDRLAMRIVYSNTGPYGAITYSDPPNGCTKPSNLDIEFLNAGTQNIVLIAYSCLEGNIYIQGHDLDNKLTRLWRTSLGSGPWDLHNPAIAAGNGDFLAVWESNGALYAQRHNYDGTVVGNPLDVYPDHWKQNYSDVVYNPVDSEYMVVFQEDEDIYYQRIDDSYPLVYQGPAYAISTANGSQSSPYTALSNSTGQFLTVWNDRRGGTYDVDVYGRYYKVDKILSCEMPHEEETGPGGSNDYQTSARADEWGAIALRPENLGDFDLYLYDSPEFSRTLATSQNGSGVVDAVLMNGHLAQQEAYIVSAEQVLGEGYIVEYMTSTAKITALDESASGEMAPNTVGRVFDVYVAANQGITLSVSAPDANIGMALFDPVVGNHQAVTSAVASSDISGVGEEESLFYLPSQDGWLGLLVWKNDVMTSTIAVESEGAGEPVIEVLVYLPVVVR